MEDLGGKQLGPYRIVAPLGKGGMATVYRAYQPSVERYVALKVLPRHYADDPNFVGRFKQEAKVIAGLEHPNVLPVYDYGEAEGYTYLVMRYVEGGTLADLLQGQPIPPSRAYPIISQISQALDYAHSRGVVHRDVKPSNVLIDEQGNCLLSDFGIARILEASAHFTATGSFVGTPAYASPEQCLGYDLDGRSDVYSLGVVLYEMATGRPPFEAETPMAVIVKHIHDPLPMPRTTNPALSEGVERVILKALAKDPADRYRAAGEVAEALAAASGEPVPPSVVARTPSAAPRPRWGWAHKMPAWGWIAGGLAGLLGLVCLAVSVGLLFTAGARSTATATVALSLTTPTASIPTVLASPRATAAPVTRPVSSPTARPPVPTTLATRAWREWASLASFPAPESRPDNVLRLDDQIWVSVESGRFYRLTLEGDIVAEVDLPQACRGHWAWDGQSLWVASENRVRQCDPNGWQELAVFEVELDPVYGIAWDGTALWVIDRNGNLVQYDRSGQRLRKLAVALPGSGWPIAMTWGPEGPWVVFLYGYAYRFDGAFATAGAFNAEQCGTGWAPSELAVYWDGEGLWIADPDQNRIIQCASTD